MPLIPWSSVLGRPLGALSPSHHANVAFHALAIAVLALAALAATTPSWASTRPLFRAGFRSFDAGVGARSLALADFSHDGRSDVMVANSGAPTVSLLVGNEDGSLGSPVTFDAGPNPSAAVAIGDLNGDGLPDIVYADGYVSDVFSVVGVLLGSSGGFHPAKTYPVGSGASWVTLSDVNGDGALDILAVNSNAFYGHSVSVLLGDGHGAFVRKNDVDFGAGVSLTSVAAGDLNGDHHVDIVGTGPGGTFAYVCFGNGDGTFGPTTGFDVGASSHAITLADLNQDGRLDLVCGGDQATVLFGRGDGTFWPRQFLGVGGEMPTVADLNRDGIPDIAFTGGSEVTVLLGMGSKIFAPPLEFVTGFSASALAVGDINGDGLLDIATTSDYTSTVSVLLGDGYGRFGDALAYPVGNYPTSVAMGDLDGDGASDLAVANSNSGDVSLLSGHGDGTFDAAGSVPVPYPNTAIIRDMNRDGIRDLVVGGRGITVFPGSGGFSFGPSQTYLDTLYLTSIAVGDLNGDGIPDLAGTYPGKTVGIHPPQFISNTAVYALLGAGDGTFPAETTYTAGQGPSDLAIVDVNGDGRNDLVVANSGASTVSVLLADDQGRLRSQVSYPTAPWPTGVATADIDGDGHLDIVLISESANELSILRGRGDGTFEAPTVIGSVSYPQALLVADLNRDGHMDLALSTAYGDGVTVLRGYGDGTFAGPELYGTGVGPQRVAVGDLNGDGMADLVVPNAYNNNVAVLRNLTVVATPTLVTLAGLEVSPERVRLTWWSPSITPAQGRVERSAAGASWADMGPPIADGPDRMTFEDRTVRAGAIYAYRLAVTAAEGTIHLGETQVHVPAIDALDLAVTPNPVSASGLISFRLPTSDASRLEIWDIAGRRVWRNQLAMGPGRFSMAMPVRALPPGAYVIRLTQSGRTVTRRMVVVR